MFDNIMEPLEPRRRPRQVDAHTDEIAKQHNFYTNDQMTLRGPARVYFADHKQKEEIMRARENRISTKHDDPKVISAMLDLVELRDWNSVKLSGSNEFKREAWIQAQARDLQIEGYKPTQTDRQEAARRSASTQSETTAAPIVVARAPAEAPDATRINVLWQQTADVGRHARQETTEQKESPQEREHQRRQLSM